jgi:hypothetical protein
MTPSSTPELRALLQHSQQGADNRAAEAEVELDTSTGACTFRDCVSAVCVFGGESSLSGRAGCTFFRHMIPTQTGARGQHVASAEDGMSSKGLLKAHVATVLTRLLPQRLENHCKVVAVVW